MKKKAITLLFVVIITLTCLCSCGKSTGTSSADTYISMAQDFIDKNDYTAAMDILQKGFAETTDERIAMMIAELSSSNTNPSSATEASSVVEDASITTETTPLESYAGTWAEENIGWEYGGMIMDVECTDETITIILSYTQSAPTSRIAEITIEEKMSNIKDGILVAELIEDGWENKTTVQINFSDPNTIQCTVVEVVSGEHAMWGFYEGQYKLFKNENAHANMSYIMDDYYALYPDKNPYTQPIYDTSKASGILAQSGLTEQEFRNICTYINSDAYDRNAYVYAAGRQYYEQYPDENTLLDNRIEEWNDYVMYGSNSKHYDEYNSWYLKNSSSLDDYLNFKIYGPKGASILGKQSKELFKSMREYPANYTNQPFLLKDFRAETNYGDTYTYSNYVLYGTTTCVIDYRDDVNYPNILEGTYYDMYVMFLGTDSDNNLIFALLSVEKSDSH